MISPGLAVFIQDWMMAFVYQPASQFPSCAFSPSMHTCNAVIWQTLISKSTVTNTPKRFSVHVRLTAGSWPVKAHPAAPLIGKWGTPSVSDLSEGRSFVWTSELQENVFVSRVVLFSSKVLSFTKVFDLELFFFLCVHSLSTVDAGQWMSSCLPTTLLTAYNDCAAASLDLPASAHFAQFRVVKPS